MNTVKQTCALAPNVDLANDTGQGRAIAIVEDGPRIYVACLASYNSGRLHGAWIDCTGHDESDMWQAVNAMLRRSPFPNVMRRECLDCGRYQDVSSYSGDVVECGECGSGNLSAPFASAEEWAIHDYEGFGGIKLAEYESIADVAAYAELIAENDRDKLRGFVWLVDDRGYSTAEAFNKCEDVRTVDCTPSEYAEEFVHNVYGDKELGLLAAYIDFGRFAHDLILGGDIDETAQGGERFTVINANEF